MSKLTRRLKARLRPTVQRRIDGLVGPLYVHHDDMTQAVAELTRMLSDRFDAEAEQAAVTGRRLDALAAAVDELRAEIDKLRSEIAPGGSQTP
jgi:cell division protein FtsB